MDVLYARSEATAREIWSDMGERPSYSTIRKILSILEEKGHVTHRSRGASFVVCLLSLGCSLPSGLPGVTVQPGTSPQLLLHSGPRFLPGLGWRVRG